MQEYHRERLWGFDFLVRASRVPGSLLFSLWSPVLFSEEKQSTPQRKKQTVQLCCSQVAAMQLLAARIAYQHRNCATVLDLYRTEQG